MGSSDNYNCDSAEVSETVKMGLGRELREELRDLEDRKPKTKKSKITGLVADCHKNVAAKSNMRTYTKLKEDSEEDVKDWAPGEWCEVCHNGGDETMYGCDRCPRVYHPKCYVPALKQEPPDDWICNMCTTKEEIRRLSANPKDGPNGSGQMGLREIQICRRLLLELFNSYPECTTFQSVKALNFRAYRRVVDTPIALDLIREKLDINSKSQYWCIRKFVDDVRKMFANCRKFWKDSREGGEYIKDANTLERKFNKLLQEWQQIVYLDSDFDEGEHEKNEKLLMTQRNNNNVKKKESKIEEEEEEEPDVDEDKKLRPLAPAEKLKTKKPEEVRKEVEAKKEVEKAFEKKRASVYLESPPQYLKIKSKSKLFEEDGNEEPGEDGLPVKTAVSPMRSSKSVYSQSKNDTSSFESSSSEKTPVNNKKGSNKRKIKDGSPGDEKWEQIDREIAKDKKKSAKYNDLPLYSEEEEETPPSKLARAAASKKEKKLQSPPKDGDLIECKFCDAVYTSASGLKGHALKHFEDKIWEILPDTKPFICPENTCPETYSDKNKLMQHYAFEHYEYLKDLSELIKPVTKNKYTVLMNKDNIHSDIERSVNNVREKEKGKKIVYDKYGNEKRSCTGSDKNYEDLSDEQIDNLQKVEGLNKGHLKKFYKEIEDSRSQAEAEESKEDTPDEEDSDGRGASIAGSISSAELPLYSYSEEERMKEEEERKRKKKKLQSPSSEKESDRNETKSDELAEEEKEDFSQFADLPLF